LLLTRDGEHWFHQRRQRGEYHGTGCSLSAAITASIALGQPLEAAVGNAIGFVQQAIAASYRPGKSRLRVLDHLHAGGSPIRIDTARN
jgi:hydroxymethylpyrimidine/phosphomethylpyrimidine kinase